MHRLIVRHESSEGEFRFVIQRLRVDGIKSAPAVIVSDPLSQRMRESTLSLGDELNWYFERYIDYPFGPNQQRADRTVQALQAWGTATFEQLFDKGQARDFYRDATRDAHTNLHLTIVSDSANVLAWPWEALRDPLVGDLAHHCRIERQLDRIEDPPQLNPNLNRDRIGILLVTARPYKQDIAYRSVSRPLVNLIFERKLPVDVKVLRPPTLKQLRAELEARAEAYHIVHFDGHGSFGQDTISVGHQSRQRVGHLVFEDAEGTADLITGAQLSQLLREYRIPIVVMNSCQSAMLDARSEDAFAAVATSLLRLGVRSVVAMGYSLYASAAREFLPAFYERLFGLGDVAEATRAGRQALLARPERRLGFHLQDWLVPVLYQQSPLALDFAKTSTAHPPDLGVIIPEEARLDNREAPHGFIGRDSAILALERASRRPPAGLLVHGLGGVGKTTLLRGYIEWLAQTRGLPETILWFSFSEVRSFDYVLNRLAERLLGANALAGSDEEKWQAVCQHLREHAALIVWDNFEAVSGQDDAVSELAFPSAERDQLKLLLEELRGGRSRVLLSSRTNEEWLGTIACYRLLIGGLEGEERQALARAVLSDQGIRFDPRDQEVADLIDSLDGHPLMMRALLPQLAFQNAKALRDAFEKYLPSMDGDNQSERRLAASLRYVDNELPDRLKPLLYPIGLHVGYVRVHYLEEMAKQAKQPFSANDIAETLSHMERAGLVQSTADDYYRLHPALARYLRARARDGRDTDQSVSWHAAFIHTAAFLVSTASFSNLAERHAYHHVFGGTIERARNLVDREDWEMFDGLTLFLAAYAYENNELHRAKRLYGEMLEHLPLKDQRGVRAAGTHLNLGLAALNEGDPVRALQSFEHARALFQELGNDSGVAQASQYIGLTHFEQGDTTKAESWFTNALTTFEGLRDEKQVSYLLHELGNCELRNRNLKKAEVLYLRSVEIKERLGDSKGAAITYQQMAGLAQDRGDLAAAESWYNRALSFATAGEEIEHQSYIYHGLGVIAQVRGNYVEAERLYVKSLQQKEKRGDRHGASLTYHQLGVLCMIRSDFEAAESWTQKSLEISREVNDKSGLTKSLVQLGVLAKLQGKPAEMHFLVASQIATEINDREALAIISEVRRGPGLLYRLLERFRGWVS